MFNRNIITDALTFIMILLYLSRYSYILS